MEEAVRLKGSLAALAAPRIQEQSTSVVESSEPSNSGVPTQLLTLIQSDCETDLSRVRHEAEHQLPVRLHGPSAH